MEAARRLRGCSGLTSSTLRCPAGRPAALAFSEGLPVVQADGLDVVGQPGTGFQVEQGDVGPGDVAERDVYHVGRHLEGVGSVLMQAAQDDAPLRRSGRAAE